MISTDFFVYFKTNLGRMAAEVNCAYVYCILLAKY